MSKAIWAGMAGVLVASAMGGCKTEPLADDRANNLLRACCAEARGRVETVHDVESQKFREQCSSCQRGKSKGDCESGAKKVQATVKLTYGQEPMPISCGTLRSGLAELGISIPEVL